MILIIDLTDPRVPVLADEFVLPVSRIVQNAGYPAQCTHLSQIQKIPAPIQGVIICGTALADSWYRSHTICPIFEDFEGPVLGICAGMQMLLMADRGELFPSLEIGMTEVCLTEQGREDSLTSGKEQFSGYALHQHSVTIPPSWVLLASSNCGDQIVRHITKSRYGVLFHPEVRNEWIIERFLKSICSPRFQEGL